MLSFTQNRLIRLHCQAQGKRRIAMAIFGCIVFVWEKVIRKCMADRHIIVRLSAFLTFSQSSMALRNSVLIVILLVVLKSAPANRQFRSPPHYLSSTEVGSPRRN